MSVVIKVTPKNEHSLAYHTKRLQTAFENGCFLFLHASKGLYQLHYESRYWFLRPFYRPQERNTWAGTHDAALKAFGDSRYHFEWTPFEGQIDIEYSAT